MKVSSTPKPSGKKNLSKFIDMSVNCVRETEVCYKYLNAIPSVHEIS